MRRGSGSRPGRSLPQLSYCSALALSSLDPFPPGDAVASWGTMKSDWQCAQRTTFPRALAGATIVWPHFRFGQIIVTDTGSPPCHTGFAVVSVSYRPESVRQSRSAPGMRTAGRQSFSGFDEIARRGWSDGPFLGREANFRPRAVKSSRAAQNDKPRAASRWSSENGREGRVRQDATCLCGVRFVCRSWVGFGGGCGVGGLPDGARRAPRWSRDRPSMHR